jgi:hypothetical protein
MKQKTTSKSGKKAFEKAFKNVQTRLKPSKKVIISTHSFSLSLSATLNRCLQQNRPKTQHKTDDNTRQTFNMISKMNTKKVPTCTQNAKKITNNSIKYQKISIVRQKNVLFDKKSG